MPALLKKGASGESLCDFEEISPKKRRVQGWPQEDTTALRDILVAALPDKEALIPGWLEALAAPSISIRFPDDVKRLDAQDITGLPVPPLVKGVFRRMLSHEAEKEQEMRQVLEATQLRQRAFLAPQKDRQMQPLLFKSGRTSTYSQDVQGYRLVLASEEIQAGVRIVARRLETWCKGERIVLVCILSGAFMFLADLCKTLVRPYSVYFVEASSYKDDRKAQGGVDIAGGFQVSKFIDTSTKAPHKIVLVDELLDNGQTMQEMKRYFLAKLADTHKEKDILTVCLLSKKRERGCPEADITGIPNLPDLWLVGYGLDDRRTKRGWTELFAIPKVKLVQTVQVEEVEKLLENLDENAVLKVSCMFAGFELVHAPKQRYRVSGLNVLGAGGARAEAGAGRAEAPTLTKADLEGMLADLPTLKGKYEQELQFAFIQENVALIAEDEIFSGNDRVFAQMRCRLRRQITAAAEKFGVEGLPPVAPAAS